RAPPFGLLSLQPAPCRRRSIPHRLRRLAWAPGFPGLRGTHAGGLTEGASGMVKTVGGFAARYPWLGVAGGLLPRLAVPRAAPPGDRSARADAIGSVPARCDSVRGYRLLERAFPQDVCASRVVFALERASARLGEADLALADDLVAELTRLRGDEPDL